MRGVMWQFGIVSLLVLCMPATCAPEQEHINARAASCRSNELGSRRRQLLGSTFVQTKVGIVVSESKKHKQGKGKSKKKGNSKKGKQGYSIKQILKKAQSDIEGSHSLDAAIDLSGNTHADSKTKHHVRFFERNGATHSKAWTLFQRPEWQKTLRCLDSTQASCEECWGDNNCWTGATDVRGDVPQSRRLVVTPEMSESHSRARFINIVHARCGADILYFKRRLLMLEGGTLRFFWDEVEMNQETTTMSLGGGKMSPLTLEGIKHWRRHNSDARVIHGEPEAESYAKISMLRQHGSMMKGGHELIAEFTLEAPIISLSKADRAQADYSAILFVEKKFKECEDGKSCLSILDAKLEKDRRLRNSNILQVECLTGTIEVEYEEVCGKWLECLHDANELQETRLLSLLHASGVDEVAKQGCLPYSEQACRDALTAHGLLLGGAGYDFASNYRTKGCYAYSSGKYAGRGYYGTRGTEADMARALSSPKYRPTNYDCQASEDQGDYAGLNDIHCLNPLTEDPESWKCDCLDEMKARCKPLRRLARYTEVLCLRALWCDHPRVCRFWKDKFCTDELRPFRNALLSSSTSFLEFGNYTMAKVATVSADSDGFQADLVRRRANSATSKMRLINAKSSSASLDEATGVKTCE